MCSTLVSAILGTKIFILLPGMSRLETAEPMLTVDYLCAHPIETADAYTHGSEHPAHGLIGQVWGDNVGRFYMMGTKLAFHVPVFSRTLTSYVPNP